MDLPEKAAQQRGSVLTLALTSALQEVDWPLLIQYLHQKTSVFFFFLFLLLKAEPEA